MKRLSVKQIHKISSEFTTTLEYAEVEYLGRKFTQAQLDADKKEMEEILEIIEDWDELTDIEGGEERWKEKYGMPTTDLVAVLEQALKSRLQEEG